MMRVPRRAVYTGQTGADTMLQLHTHDRRTGEALRSGAWRRTTCRDKAAERRKCGVSAVCSVQSRVDRGTRTAGSSPLASTGPTN